MPAPVWFHLKTKSSCSEGSRHLWRTIKFSRYLTPELKAIVDPVIQRNGYFGTSENILIAMFTEDRQQIRELEYRRILAARSEHPTNSKMTVKQFRAPVLNFDVYDYIDFVAWQNIDRYDSPIMNNYSVSQIRAFIDNTDVIQLPHFPFHTKAAEKCI